MRTLRVSGALGVGFSLALSLALLGCGTGDSHSETETGDTGIAVVQVTTLTTVQASSGLFLSPAAQRDLPNFVERGAVARPVAPTEGLDRAEVDLALLFEGDAGASTQLTAKLGYADEGDWSPVEHSFPVAEPTSNGSIWPIELTQGDDVTRDGVSTEWSGWQGFGGLGVRTPGDQGAPSAAVAALDFEVRGSRSPLVLSSDLGVLTVRNQSNSPIDRALLIYSHPGGVGVTEITDLRPGASSVTMLGPKEHPPETLLEMARGELREFFAASVGPELGAAMADAKSIPFLETQGLRLISLLDVREAPTLVGFSPQPASHKNIVVSHSEIFKLEEEQRMVGVVADETLEASQVRGDLGRFTEAKLEYVSVNADAAVSARAKSLLEQLRAQ
jgi:hypothetical protein